LGLECWTTGIFCFEVAQTVTRPSELEQATTRGSRLSSTPSSASADPRPRH